jgi:anaerobic magnesium-protoporphyrin IX monomethyl ester cyclase
MKILMVMPNFLDESRFLADEGTYYMSPGLLHISSYAKSKGFNVHCLNLNHYGPKKLTEVLMAGDFDVLCTGGLHTDLHRVIRIIKETRQYSSSITTILGGSMPTSHPSLVFDMVQPDFMVLREGEETCAELLTTLENNGDPANVLGIAYKKDGEFFETPERSLSEDLDSYPLPDYEGFEYAYYMDNHSPKKSLGRYSLAVNRFSMVSGSRDCPAKCTFCFRNMGGDYRIRSVDSVMSEIRYLMDNYGVNQISLNDEIFALNRRRVYEFCDKIKLLDIPWACQMRVNLPDDEILLRMKDAGCCLISYGFESASPSVLKSMQKGVRVEQIENALLLTNKHQITIQANWIFGDPAETVETVLETLEFNRKYQDANINMFFLAAYPGTPLYFDVLEKGLIKDKPNFFLNSTGDEKEAFFNLTEMTYDERSALELKIRLESEKNYMRGKANSCEQNDDGRYKMSICCPTCDYEDIYHIKVEGGALSVSTSMTDVCNNCLSRFTLQYYDVVCYHNVVKKTIIKYTVKAFMQCLFILSLKFEPDFYRKKTTRYLYYPVYILVDTLRLNTIIIKLLFFYRKNRGRAMKISLNSFVGGFSQKNSKGMFQNLKTKLNSFL